MSDKLPNVKYWTPAHFKKHLKRHMNNSSYNEDDIEKIEKQNIGRKAFFRLTIQMLTNENGLFKIKFGNATDIMELVEELKEKQAEEHSMSVEVVTTSEFNKLHNNYQKILKENNRIISNMLSEIKRLHEREYSIELLVQLKHPKTYSEINGAIPEMNTKANDATSDLSFNTETINNSVDLKLSRDKKTVTNGNDQDLKLSLSIGDNIFALSFIENNLSCNMKIITCTDSEDVPFDEISGQIATQPLDRN
ncbi:11345_t:CDS:2 [Funneliformis mosseae]|uniref:11345_t:CDS:1 n=1 Tax=Funneliformis mosseae TaxID=27381 RepID=A0A9N9G643_FUNMO|nr:11345_t:CDS:2 [Funneliformis mosseae]